MTQITTKEIKLNRAVSTFQNMLKLHLIWSDAEHILRVFYEIFVWNHFVAQHKSSITNTSTCTCTCTIHFWMNANSIELGIEWSCERIVVPCTMTITMTQTQTPWDGILMLSLRIFQSLCECAYIFMRYVFRLNCILQDILRFIVVKFQWNIAFGKQKNSTFFILDSIFSSPNPNWKSLLNKS